jgi:hypothetical protein
VIELFARHLQEDVPEAALGMQVCQGCVEVVRVELPVRCDEVHVLALDVPGDVRFVHVLGYLVVNGLVHSQRILLEPAVPVFYQEFLVLELLGCEELQGVPCSLISNLVEQPSVELMCLLFSLDRYVYVIAEPFFLHLKPPEDSF